MRKGTHLVGLSQVYVSRCTVRRMQNQTRNSPALWNPKVWLYKQGCSLVHMGVVQHIPVTSLTVFSRTNPLISYNPLITIFLIVKASFFPHLILTKIQHNILLYITRTTYQACWKVMAILLHEYQVPGTKIYFPPIVYQLSSYLRSRFKYSTKLRT